MSRLSPPGHTAAEVKECAPKLDFEANESYVAKAR